MSGKPTFTPEQRAEVARLALEHDLSSEEIADQASAVGLGRLRPFEISPSTVREIAAEARRGAPLTEPSALSQLSDEIVDVLRAELEQLKEQQAEGGLDLERVRKVVVCLERLHRGDKRRPRIERDDDEPLTPTLDRLRALQQRDGVAAGAA